MSLAFLKPLSMAVIASSLLLACQPNPNDVESNSINESQAADNAMQVEANTTVNTNQEMKPSTTHPVTQNNTPAQSIEQPITILALGDSLTEGLGVAQEEAYPAQLQDTLNKAGYVNTKVVNSGLSGETSTGLVNRLDWVLKTKPDITILTIGANDAMRGIDVDVIEKNIRTAIERLQEEGSIVILGGMQVYDNLGNKYVSDFSNLYPQLAEEYDIAFIPFFLEGVGGVATLNQADAIHPTKEGYTKIVNDNILPVLSPVLEGIVEDEADVFNEIDQ